MSGGLWYSPLLKAGSTLNSDLVAQGFIQLYLESLQGCTACLCSSFQCLTVLVLEKLFLIYSPRAGKAFSYIQSEPLMFPFVSVVYCQPTIHCKEPVSVFLIRSLLKVCC